MTDSVRLYLFINYAHLRDKLVGFACDLGYEIVDGYASQLHDLKNAVALVDNQTQAPLVLNLSQKIPVIGFLDSAEALRWPLKNRFDPYCDFEIFKSYFSQYFPAHHRYREEIDLGLIKSQSPWDDLSQKIQLASQRDCFVLIQGESGTGKELVARSIHQRSPRSQKPFVAINCGAIPHDLIESEFFGYDKGAFTGATQSKVGKFEAVADGTLFLDEVGDMPVGMQIKLLRVLQEREFERLGSNQLKPFKARVICATHRSLRDMVEKKEFRQDLYYRLNVLPLHLPPLRQRIGDLEQLIDNIVKKEGMNISFHNEALDYLRQYSWPGNIRELFNILCRADVFFSRETISLQQVKILFDDGLNFS